MYKLLGGNCTCDGGGGCTNEADFGLDTFGGVGVLWVGTGIRRLSYGRLVYYWWDSSCLNHCVVYLPSWRLLSVMDKDSWVDKVMQSDAARFRPEVAKKIIEDWKKELGGKN